jgi:SAM-dependent methyltransferase
VAANGSRRSLLRHTAHYLAAAQLAPRPERGWYVDVGGGVGALGVWLAERIGPTAHLVDADPTVRAVAGEAFPEATVHADPADLPAACAALVTGMEVVEHVPPGEQTAFVGSLARLLAPGGMLVVSTPDESRYLGGWSGYAPHVGVLDAEGLRTLLRAATGLEPRIWRLEGEPFALGAVERLVLPVANRAWGSLSARAPAVAARLGRAGRHRAVTVTPDEEVAVRGVPVEQGQGTGLLAAVRAPG